MATKLKNLKIRKVDFVDEGANPDAHIGILKHKDGEQAAEKSGEKVPGFMNRLLSFIGKAAGMNQEEIDAFDGKCEALRQPLRPILVVVPPDNIERGVLPELVHNGLGVDIAAVDDDVSLGQVSHHLRPQKAVGSG